ncbi:hypothetical protein Tco_0313333 [Tanacetum coccineum]
MMYVDGTVCKDFRVGRKRPPTTMWTKELLKEQELVEIKSEGLGKGELEGPYVEEQDDPMPGNLEVNCDVGLFFKLKDVVLKEHLMLQKRCFRGIQCLLKDETREYEGQEQSMEAGDHTCGRLESPRYHLDPQTQAIVFESADKLYKEFEHEKRIQYSEIPSFSIGLTQDFEMRTGLGGPEYDMGKET